MKQADLGLNLNAKRTRKREFLEEVNRVVPRADLVALIAPFAPEGKKGRPPFAVETMLRIHFMQQWFTLSDPAMEEALHDVALFREFAGLDNWTTRLADESTILRFGHLLEKHKLAEQVLAVVNELLRVRGLLLKAGTMSTRIQFTARAPSAAHASDLPKVPRPMPKPPGDSLARRLLLACLISTRSACRVAGYRSSTIAGGPYPPYERGLR